MRELDRQRARATKQRLDAFLAMLRERKMQLLPDERHQLRIARRALGKLMERVDAL